VGEAKPVGDPAGPTQAPTQPTSKDETGTYLFGPVSF
jgi:hypothetical protein